MSPTQPSPEPPIEPAPPEEAVASADEAAAPAPKRRWRWGAALPGRRAAATPAEGAADAADGETAAVPPEVAGRGRARPRAPRRLRRERKKLVARREVAVYDLGGLAFELYRRDLLTEEVMRLRAQEVAELDEHGP